MLVAAWLAACAAFAWATRRRPVVAVAASLVVWVAIPVVAGSLVTGRDTGLLGAHPGGWLVLATLAVQLLHAPQDVLHVVARRVHLAIGLVLVVLVAGFTTQQNGTGGLALLLDMIVAPVALFVLVLAVTDRDPRAVGVLRTTVLAVAAASAALAVVQWVAGDVLLFGPQRLARSWWFDEDFDRWMATTDHPLTLSLLLCVAAPLLVGVRRASLQLGLLALMVAGVVITQSRSGVVVMGVVAVWVVLRSSVAAHVRLLSLCALAGGAAALLGSGLVEGVAARFADDTGSTGARTDALAFFGETWDQYAVVGHGLTASYRVAAQGGLQTSLESSFLMYAVDIGLVFAVIYFGAQALLVLESWRNARPVPGARVGALVAFVLPLTYSALAARSAAATVLWVALALGVVRWRGGADDAPTSAPGSAQGAVPVPLSRRTVTGEPSSA